jgi:hypothetical protein
MSCSPCSARKPSTLLASLLALSLLVAFALSGASVAHAAAAVTVRVEGINQTLLAPTQVTTDAAAVVKDGNSEHSCSGLTAAGAVEGATPRSWGGGGF